MQQTETCKLNLIETSDPFSPDALNENARTLDAQLARVDAAAAAEKARVDAAAAAEKARVDAAAAAEKARVDAALAAKAEKTALTAEETARKAEDARLASEIARVDGVLNGRVRFASGQYTGDGVLTSSAKFKRLEFPFKPMLVVITDTTHAGYGGYLWARGNSRGTIYNNNGSLYIAIVQWEDRAVAWYHSNTSALYHLNDKGATYFYLAFGVVD